MEEWTMSWKRIIGILLALAGIALVLTSNYISDQVEAGKEQINSAQEKVDKGSSLFSLSPYTKDVGKEITDSAQKKIDAGKLEVIQYETLAGKLKIGGIALIVVGGLLVIFGRRKKR